MKLHYHILTIASASLFASINPASGQTAQPNSAQVVNATTLSKVVFTDTATGRKYSIVKDGQMWTGSHPAFEGYGLRMRRSRRNQNPGHIMELSKTGSGQFLHLKIDTRTMMISHSVLAPWAATDGSGGIDYRYQAKLPIESVE